MRGPKPPQVALSDEARRALEAVVRGRQTAQQVAQRARIILAAADGENNSQIARRLGIEADTARLWRTRWLALAPLPLAALRVAERLADAPRPGGPCRSSAEQVCRIVALACELPAASGRPISHWTGREIADEAVARGIVAAISPRHAARLLKRGCAGRLVHPARLSGSPITRVPGFGLGWTKRPAHASLSARYQRHNPHRGGVPR